MRRLLLLITLPLWLIDQATKWLVLENIGLDDLVVVIPGFFYLVQAHNTGAAFSLLQNNNTFFIGLSVVALVAMVIFAKRAAFADRWMAIGGALLIAGILGNLVDRIVHGHVIDFLLVDLHVWPANPWPVFNVADSCICIAAGLFVIRSFFDHPQKPAQIVH